MYPLVGEVNLYAVNVIDLLLCIDALDLLKDGIDIGAGLEVDTVLGYEIGRISLAELADGLALMRQMAQEQGDTYQSVTAVVECGLNDSAVALTADNGTGLLHLGGNINLTNGSGIVLAAVLTGNVTQCAG